MSQLANDLKMHAGLMALQVQIASLFSQQTMLSVDFALTDLTRRVVLLESQSSSSTSPSRSSKKHRRRNKKQSSFSGAESTYTGRTDSKCPTPSSPGLDWEGDRDSGQRP